MTWNLTEWKTTQVFSDKSTEKHIQDYNQSFYYITERTNLPPSADEGVYVGEGEKVKQLLQNQNRWEKVKEEVGRLRKEK